MALESGNTRRSLRHTDSGAVDKTIIESEQTLDYTFDGDYNYLQQGESTFVSASGSNSTPTTSSLTYNIKGLTASGKNVTESVANLTFDIEFVGSGISSTENTALLGFDIGLVGSGFSSTASSGILGNFTNILGSGSSTTVSEADIHFIKDIISSGESSGDGTGTLGFLYTVNGNSFGFGNKDVASLGITKDIVASGIGQGEAFISSITSIPSEIIATGIGEGLVFSSLLDIDGKTQEELEKRGESYFIGDVEIPLLISRDLSVDRNTEAKHFVNADSQFFQENANYERGTFTAVLNQKEHSEGKTLEEQTDDLRKLLDRLPQENEIDYVDGKAYLAVQSINDVVDVDQNTREVEMDVILMESTEF